MGNLRTALYTYLIAKHEGGDFILRIEDTDQERYVEGAVDIIYRTMEKTGLIHDEGPDKDGGYGPYVQSERQRSGIYMELVLTGRDCGLAERAPMCGVPHHACDVYVKKLVEKGEAYYCFCTQERLDSLKKNVNGEEIMAYDKHCLGLSKEEVEANLKAGMPFVIRQNNPKEGTTTFHDDIYGDISVDNSELDDMVLIKSDGYPTYNFANVVDDHLMGITHVIRGSEYLSSTPKYNLLYKDFGWDIPTYIHCPPVMKDAQNKLSKRNGDASYQDLVAKGYLKEAVLNYILLLGWSPKGEREIFTLPEMIEVFDESGIGKAPAIFDPAKLRYINAEYIRAMSEEAFFEKAEPYIDSVVKTPCNKALLAQVLHQRCELMSDIPEQIDFIDEMPEYDLAMYTNKKMKTTAETAKEALEAILPVLEAIPADGFTRDAVHAALFALIEEKGVKNGFMLWPLRVAVSGKQFTPGGGIELAAVLGKEKAVARVKAAIQRL